jgi:hypothetical protein
MRGRTSGLHLGIVLKGLRRFTRLTNAHSKTLANMKDAVALYVAFYNFCRVNGALGKRTPAMAARLTDHAWTLAEMLTTS